MRDGINKDVVCRTGKSRRRLIQKLMPALGVVGVLAMAVGCNHDQRISYRELLLQENAIAVEESAVEIQPTQLALTDYQPYQLRVGDILLIQIRGLKADYYDVTEFQVRVHSDGNIDLPVVGEIVVKDLTLGQAEEAIIDAHVKGEVARDELVSVFLEVTQTEGTTVLVLGAAANPGLVALEYNRRNPLYAMAAVGGFNEVSSGKIRVLPIRPERGEICYDFRDINDVRSALSASPLEPGDTIIVEAADSDAQSIYVTGIVNAPGPIRVPPNTGLSVLRAIASSGGIRPYTKPREATLVRHLPDGKQVQVKLEIGKMLAGEMADVVMKPGDVLHVPETAETFVQDWAMRNLQVGPFSVGVRYDPLQQYNTNRAISAENDNGALINSLRSTIPQLLVPTTAP